MPCYSCGESFGFFTKERGCKNCGFAFCNKCLTKKTGVPKLDNEKHHVCNKCYNILTGKIKPKEEPQQFSPPENYLKRVAALEERENTGGSSSSQHSRKRDHKSQQKYMNLGPAEREIAERLDKLREKPPQKDAAPKLTEKDIATKLAKLKGENPDIQAGNTRPVYRPPDRRTQQAQIDDLLDEIAGEVELDSRLPDPVKQIEQRLAKLKGDNSQANDQKPDNLENNLNKTSKDAHTYNLNIEEDKSKKSNKNGGEISVEEMNKLIEQAATEVNLDAKKALEDLQKDKDIMKRLQEIKSRKKDDVNKQDGTSRSGNENEDSDSDNENEEELTKNLVKQLLEESKLDEAAGRDGVTFQASDKKSNQAAGTNTEEYEDDDDELPYCTLCTEDATLRCYGCDRDLYCNRCWKECHVDFQMEDHETTKYIKPKGRT